MLTRFRNFIAQHDLADRQDHILLAVSGGIDSMVMLDLFRQAGFTIGIAHCNFQLRGEDSDGDEIFVKRHCDKRKIKFYSKRFESNNYAKEKGISIQMAARQLRYEWFDTLMEEGGYHWLATAHHVNDNIETVLLRWTNGASLEHLMGIPVRNGKIIRPMLFASRDEIATYAGQEGIEWREDRTNATDDYQRNFIRHQVIPKLKELNPSLETTFSDSLGKIQGAYEMMQRGLGQLKDNITRTQGEQFYIDKSLLSLLQQPVFVCYEWLKVFGFDWNRCEQMVKAIGAQSGKQFLSSTHQAVIDREYIVVTPRREAFNELLIEEGADKAALGPWILTIRKAVSKNILMQRDAGSIDAGKVKFPMIWRKWRNGDSFFPLGLGHSKKVSDFLIDEKISLADKSEVTVIESNGEIVWIVGLRVDDRFKVTAQTKYVLELKVTHI